MSVKIRLKRMGSSKRPTFRIIVVDSRFPGKGRRIQEIGTYLPRAKGEQVVNLDKDSALSWIKKGARPSQSVLEILEKNGVVEKGTVASTA